MDEQVNTDGLRALLAKATDHNPWGGPYGRQDATNELLHALPAVIDRLAAVEYRLQCANLYGHQCDADISELIKRAEKAEADLAALIACVAASGRHCRAGLAPCFSSPATDRTADSCWQRSLWRCARP